ncbi:hypothetical protein JZ751_013521 [Albula glossodonta]|uniref:Uncharacterized protein n=1 Tax=Albula glossodonta TaxID=121402 RepID=A0A8T2N9C6_9TELE|nr:hypothetical protein JZ751_013521 [Albula glossodonta]
MYWVVAPWGPPGCCCSSPSGCTGGAAWGTAPPLGSSSAWPSEITNCYRRSCLRNHILGMRKGHHLDL